jgi:phosphatidylglycerol---prolipoprotein diacylglyceryl transferase
MIGLVDEHARWLLAAPVYTAAYVAAAMIFWWMAGRRGLAGNARGRILSAGLIGGLVGANVIQLLVTGLPGKTIEGGIVGGWIAVVLVKRQIGLTRPTGDLFALAIPLGEAIGRIGCFIGGCCYGKVAGGLPWAVYDHGAWRHPTQLYLAILAAGCFACLLWLERRAFLPDGTLLYVSGMLFCIDRFIVEFFRDGASMAGPLTLAQLACLLGFAFCAMSFVRMTSRSRRYA